MPAKTTFQEIQAALKSKSIKKQLPEYAIGVLVYEQSKYRNAQVKALKQLKRNLMKLPALSQEHHDLLAQIENVKRQPDLGFYYTLLLFDKAVEMYPIPVKTMIEAVLSFDCFGRYLFQKGPIMVDDQPFEMDVFLKKHAIDTSRLEATIYINQDHSPNATDEFYLLKPNIEVKPIVFSQPAILGSHTAEDKRLFDNLVKEASAVEVALPFWQLMKDIPYNFDLITRWPTQKNINQFLSVLAELFVHAKMQDISRLDTLNIPSTSGSKRSDLSRVALFQNILVYWLIISLLHASDGFVFKTRLKFLMAALVQANKKVPGLPSDATADMYLPLISFSLWIFKSNLKCHPDVQPHLPLLSGFQSMVTAAALTSYTNCIKIQVGKKKESLPPMRMLMTTKLAWGSELSTFFDEKMAEKFKQMTAQQIEAAVIKENIQDAIKRGNAIYDYFNPKRQLYLKPLKKISYEASQFFDQAPVLEKLEQTINYFMMFDLIELAMPIYDERKSMDKRLKVLASGLVSSVARVYIYVDQSFSRLNFLEGKVALDFIERELFHIKTMLEGDDSVDLNYRRAVDLWCTDLLRQLSCLKSSKTIQLDMEASLSQPKSWTYVGRHLESSVSEGIIFGGFFSSNPMKRAASLSDIDEGYTGQFTP